MLYMVIETFRNGDPVPYIAASASMAGSRRPGSIT